ncbi:twin-arginine translocase TatA/TatE family subunit [bacterium]|nr:twin-arginine translocase TatA/TatE family subunit [bacterium]
MFGSVGTTELLVILLVVLLVFDIKQLPQIARSLGKAWKDFQKTTRSAQDEMRKLMEDEDEKLRG